MYIILVTIANWTYAKEDFYEIIKFMPIQVEESDMKKYFIKILCGVVYLVSFIALGMIFVNLMPKNDLFYVDSNNSDIVYVILYVGSVISFQIGAMNYRLKGTDKK